MRIVGIDTAGGTASVALVKDGLLLAERTDSVYKAAGHANRRNSNHAETLLPLLELLFESTGLSLHDIDGFALSIGPGSFTGLRIGLSTIKGLAYGWQIPVVGVSTLSAHASRVIDNQGLICALLDARKNEVYAALFRKADGIVDRVTEDAVTSVVNVIEMIRGYQLGAPCLFIGDGAGVYTDLLMGLPGAHILETTNYPTVAATVARLGEDRFRFNSVEDLGALTPVYLRQSEAEFKRRSSLNSLIIRR
jgi:tRNA threonylcarbamoyladenosine biosynthesis protein TsaB